MQLKTAQGTEIPEIGLGTYTLIGKECKKTVLNALEIGYRHIDTAQIYQNEREIGEALQVSEIDREELFITTKVWYTNLDHDDVLQSAEDSLRFLKTPYVDLLLIHWPNNQYPLEQTLEAMLSLKDQGKVLHIGVSNFPLQLTRTVIEEYRIPLFTNQVEFHPFLGQFDMLDLSYDNDFLVTAYSPLAKGDVFNDTTLRRIASEYGKTPAQIALRWLIEQENVIAIPKAASTDHLKENYELYDFELSDEHFDEIDQLEKSRRMSNPSFAPDWNS
jgi:2,5-diketo-D-gluconate reductase B